MGVRNPLLDPPGPRPRWREVRPAHVQPALRQLLDEAAARVDAIVAEPGTTYDGTLGAIARATEPLEAALGILAHLQAVAGTRALERACEDLELEVADFLAALGHDPRILALYERYAATDDARALTGERRRHLACSIRDLERQGARLGLPERQRIAHLAAELALETSRFSANVDAAVAASELRVEDPARLGGLPEHLVEAARAEAAARGQAGATFTLAEPTFVPLITHADDRALREEAWRAWNRRAAAPPFDNAPVVRRVLALRDETARLLGYPSFAALAVEDRMAGSVDAVRRFLADLEAAARPAAEAERQELEALARADGLDALASWDVAYYAERQRRALHAHDDEALRAYLPLGAVIDGMWALVERLFGTPVREASGVHAWHKDVRTFELTEPDGRLIAWLHLDLLPRRGKREGTWMAALWTGDPAARDPHVGAIVASLAPGDRGPRLLGHPEVRALFHELGHLLHHAFGAVETRSLSGTRVAVDLAELPSQLLERWAWEPEVLAGFARHHRTGAPLPAELVSSLGRSRAHRQASTTMRTLGFASLDLALHDATVAPAELDPIAFARAHLARFAPAPLPEGYAFVCAMTHLFADEADYAGGYYAYLWAAVLEADVFARFRAEGLFDRALAGRLRSELLARGDTEDPMVLYQRLMNRTPELESLFVDPGRSPA